MKATHTDYKHPRHLRVVHDNGFVGCMSPSHSQYSRLNKAGLPSFTPRRPRQPPTMIDYKPVSTSR